MKVISKGSNKDTVNLKDVLRANSSTLGVLDSGLLGAGIKLKTLVT